MGRPLVAPWHGRWGMFSLQLPLRCLCSPALSMCARARVCAHLPMCTANGTSCRSTPEPAAALRPRCCLPDPPQRGEWLVHRLHAAYLQVSAAPARARGPAADSGFGIHCSCPFCRDGAANAASPRPGPVYYNHLTLPTNRHESNSASSAVRKQQKYTLSEHRLTH